MLLNCYLCVWGCRYCHDPLEVSACSLICCNAINAAGPAVQAFLTPGAQLAAQAEAEQAVNLDKGMRGWHVPLNCFSCARRATLSVSF